MIHDAFQTLLSPEPNNFVPRIEAILTTLPTLGRKMSIGYIFLLLVKHQEAGG